MKNVADIYPLTPAQAGILFHTLQAPDSGVYFEQYVCTLSGPLKIEIFREAWQGVVNRHPALRTAFIWEGIDEPLQVVRQTVDLPLMQEDWRQFSADAQRGRLETYLRTDRTRGFTPAKAPLMRLALFRLEAEVHQMVWSFHHLQLDGWSTTLVLREVFDSYEAMQRGEMPTRSAPRPFKEYVGWLKKQDLQQAESFWKKELAGFTVPTTLRVDREWASRNPAGGYRQRSVNLSEPITAALHQLAQQHRLTLNTIVQGAWAILLSRYSGERDVIFGTTVSGRPADLSGVESMIGMFINTLPARIQVDPQDELLPWLKSIQSRQLELRRFEYSPLARIQAWSDIPQGQPLFDTIVVFENYPVDGSAFQNGHPSLRVDNVRYLEQSNYPLSILAVPGAGLQLIAIYDSGIFADEVLIRLLGHLDTILSGIAADVTRTVGTIPLLTPPELHQIRDNWNNTRLDIPQPPYIQQFIEQHAAQNPERLAVVDSTRPLTYGELDQRANQLARYLQKLGVGPNTPVGLLLDRSTEMMVAILGVLKAGGAYLPLDPAYPPERLTFMLADTEAPVVLTHHKLADALPSPKAATVFIDADWQAIAREADTAPTLTADPKNLAYVIYTSGSTGKPKGVPVSHQNLVHSTSARFSFYEEAVDRFLLLPSFTFDSSVVGIFWTLCQGGTLVLPPPRIEQDMQHLATIIAVHQISHILTLPSLYGILLEQADAAQLGSLRTVIVAGEACRPGLVAQHYRRLPQATLFNEYGPTEGTVWSTAYQIPADFNGRHVPVGRPVPNMQTYILDHHGQLAPIGVPGELCIAGAGVTQGYLNRPELTAEKFIDHAFGDAPPVRLYRTGDLARYLPDGNIEFLGRIDHQVKIRGFRIELGEIEAALSRHPAVRQAVVVAHTPDSGIKQLAAYVELTGSQSSSAGELRRYLLDKLPDYMAPTAFVLLEALPVTPNGKIDRNKLPAPDSDSSSVTAEPFVAPRTWVEEKLATIWAGVLGRESVGIHDDFFELGGDSILSIQIIAKAAQQKIRLKPNHIFQYPSVAALAGVAEVGSVEIEAQQTTVTGSVPLTPIQHWFFEQQLAQPHHWNQAYLLELAPVVDLVLMERSLQQLFLHHDALRLRFERTETGWTQENTGPERSMRVTRHDLADLPEVERPAALESMATQLQQSLDLTEGELVRAGIFEFGPGQPARLLLVAHHLAVDGISWQILLEDLETAYHHLQREQRIELPAKTTSFQQWAEKLTALAQNDDLQADLDYWLEAESAVSPALVADFPDRITQNMAGSAITVAVSLTPDETRALLQQVPAAYQTQINDALLTALLLAFADQTGADSLNLDMEGHGREALFEDVDLSRTVGWFTTVFPLHLHLPDDADAGKALISVKEQLRRIPRRGLSYGLLRYVSRDTRVSQKLTGQPQPVITFNYLGQFDQTLSGFSLFRAAAESAGEERSPNGQRRYLLDINSLVEQGQLVIRWSYSRHCFQPETIAKLADSYIQNLRAIIGHCTAPGVGGFTPSDFPLMMLGQAELNTLALGVAKNSQAAGIATAAKNIETLYPLSPMQQLMLLHALSQPNSRVLVTQMRYTLRGKINGVALQKAWQQIVTRHPALRTAFDWQSANQPVQVVWREARLDFEQHDLRHLSSPEQAAELSAILAADRARGFDLAQPPLMRIALAHLADDTVELIWSSHHLIMDRWCITIILQEMFELYAQAVGNAPETQLARVQPFVDYIGWVKQQDEGEAEKFWRQRLAGFTRPTLLACSPAPTPTPTARHTQKTSVPPSTVRALQTIARQHRLTLNTLVQGAWALLLNQQCHADDVVFGATVSGRPADIAGIESMVGSFINNLPVRVKIDRTQPILDWLQTLQSQQIAMQPFEYVAPAKIHAWSELPSRAELFDTLLIFQAPITAPERGSGPFEIAEVNGDLATIYPFTLSAFEEGEQLRMWATVNPAQIDETAAEQILSQLIRLLEDMAKNTATSVGDLLDKPGPELRLQASPHQNGHTPGLQAKSPVASRTETERQLVTIWESILGRSPIGLQDNFFELGGTSLQAMHLFTRIEAQFGQSLPLASLIQGATIERLAKILEGSQPERWSALVPIQPEGENPPFFCIHGLTGDILWFRELGRCLAPEQPLYGIQARGLDGLAEPFSQIEPMAAYYIEQMRTLQPKGPYYFGGASFGGTVALEMAQQLLAQGEQVGLLVMFDHAPAQAGQDGAAPSLTSTTSVGLRLASNFPHWLGSFAQLGIGPIMARVRRKARVALKQAGDKVGGSSPNGEKFAAADLLDYGAQMPDFRQQMIANHFQAAETYIPKAYPGRVTLFQARAQPLIKPIDPVTGWKMLKVTDLDIEIVPGSHEGMFKSPHVQRLAEHLRDRLRQARART